MTPEGRGGSGSETARDSEGHLTGAPSRIAPRERFPFCLTLQFFSSPTSSLCPRLWPKGVGAGTDRPVTWRHLGLELAEPGELWEFGGFS